MSIARLAEEEVSQINVLVDHYQSNLPTIERLGKSLFELTQDERLRGLIHSARWRAKDRSHLFDKLARRMVKCREGKLPFDVTADNLFEKINDLVGVRILHLHTGEFPKINSVLLDLLGEEDYQVIEGPEARVWDHEYQGVFEGFGVSTQTNPRMYTSVHYVISAGGRAKRTAEIQVRTLAEELWGEVDHQINYPHPSEEIALTEQIRVLARVVSSCTRLVDSIFKCRVKGGSAGVPDQRP
jgi:putative GTP pyrophosphokinase